ncbi:MAG: NOG1 family protein [Methanobacteriaceae archaeon]
MMIPTIPTPEELLDKGFRRGKKAADQVRTTKIPKRLKGKRIEEARFITACQVIKDRMKMILDRVPDIEELPEFYQDYIDITVGVDDMKQSLGALNWAYGIITQLEKDYASKIRRAPSEKANMLRGQGYGRVASVVNKIKKDLDFLDFAKAKLRNMPTIDFEAITVVIAGFPNVGKSTLLRQITDAEPAVANYPFTTKGIQIGHMEHKWNKIQIIDTPGLLDRPIQDMNPIELNAMVALEHLADMILFIFDGSETCGFRIQNQMNLLDEIENVFDTDIIIAINKVDITKDGSKAPEGLQSLIDTFDNPLLISASQGEGIEEVINEIIATKKKDINPEVDTEIDAEVDNEVDNEVNNDEY